MNALTPGFPPAATGSASKGEGFLPTSGRAGFGQGAASATSMKWAALQDAAAAVAILAGVEPERASPHIRNFPALIRDAGGWRFRTAENGIADLAAIMEPGLAALLAVKARGADAAPAALALWREFQAARTALLALVPQGGALGPRRSA